MKKLLEWKKRLEKDEGIIFLFFFELLIDSSETKIPAVWKGKEVFERKKQVLFSLIINEKKKNQRKAVKSSLKKVKEVRKNLSSMIPLFDWFVSRFLFNISPSIQSQGCKENVRTLLRFIPKSKRSLKWNLFEVGNWFQNQHTDLLKISSIGFKKVFNKICSWNVWYLIRIKSQEFNVCFFQT